MESKDLRDLVRFAEDGPQHGTVFESAHLWSEVVCLERDQRSGRSRTRTRTALRPGRPARSSVQVTAAAGAWSSGRRRSSPPGPSSRSRTRRSSPRWSSWSPRRRPPPSRVQSPRSSAPRRGRSTARTKARAKLGRLAPSAESNSGKGSPSSRRTPSPSRVTHASGPGRHAPVVHEEPGDPRHERAPPNAARANSARLPYRPRLGRSSRRANTATAARRPTRSGTGTARSARS